MIKCRVLSAACIGTLFYVVVSICCGRNSIWAEKQLNEQKRLLSMHTASIEKTNEELNLEKVALEKDMDVVAAYARKLSYIREGEKLVKVSGLAVHEHQIYDPGFVMLHKEVKYFPEWFCKSTGLVMFALAYSVMLALDAGHSLVRVRSAKKGYYNGMQGLPVV